MPVRTPHPERREPGACVPLLLLALVGCHDYHDSFGPPDLPSPYEYIAPDVGENVDPVTMQAELQATFDELRTFNGSATLTAYGQALLHGDGSCPNEVETDTENNGHTAYFDGLCVARTRYWFKGPMTTYAFTDNALDAFEISDFHPVRTDDGVAWTGTALKGQTDIYDDRSDLDFNCSCTAVSAYSFPGPGEGHWFSYVDGPSHYTAPEAAPGTWINLGLQVKLYAYLQRHLDGAWEARLAGTVTGLTDRYGTIDLDLSFGGVRAADGTIGCAAGGGGSVGMRYTTTGVRTELAFATDGASCVVCSPAGDGTVCLDLTSVADWETAPW
ncbi:MAG: hypothetical protein Q8P41_19285 [Pseudomonadota bacterium]|nr:hypothetical protein [Pseudomonadota bacterium]